MMMAMEATTSVLDRSLKTSSPLPQPQRMSITDKWAMRRWSLRGTADTRGKSSTSYAPCPVNGANVGTSPTPTPPAPVAQLPAESEKEKRKRSRSVDFSPLQSNLKKAPSALSAKLAQCVEAMGLRDAVHRYKHKKQDDEVEGSFPQHPQHDSKERHVHFPSSTKHFKQVFDRPETTEKEKAQYHYSRQELLDMVLEAKEALVREARFSVQPENTILEQGFLTFPNEKHFFHHKRYYCVLKARELLCYTTPTHAAKQVNVKCKIPILKVQECSTMSNQAKIAAFGAHLPACLSLLFYVTKADGERVLLAAASRTSKKSWVNTLLRLTQAHEPLPPCVLRQASTTSTASTCNSEDESDHSPSSSGSDEDEVEKHEVETPETPEHVPVSVYKEELDETKLTTICCDPGNNQTVIDDDQANLAAKCDP